MKISLVLIILSENMNSMRETISVDVFVSLLNGLCAPHYLILTMHFDARSCPAE